MMVYPNNLMARSSVIPVRNFFVFDVNTQQRPCHGYLEPSVSTPVAILCDALGLLVMGRFLGPSPRHGGQLSQPFP